MLALLAVFATISFTGVLFILRRDRAQAVASEMAGWLTAVRRAGERGSGCAVTITTGVSLAPNATMATTTPAACGFPALVPQAGPNTRFIITATPSTSSTFSFTPRGTVFVASQAGTPILISISSLQGGAPIPPARCVRIAPPLGLIEVANNSC